MCVCLCVYTFIITSCMYVYVCVCVCVCVCMFFPRVPVHFDCPSAVFYGVREQQKKAFNTFCYKLVTLEISVI